jgi:hypothetical protein
MHEKRRRAVLDAKMSELSQTEGKLKAALFEVISVFACGYGSTTVISQVYSKKCSWRGGSAADDACPHRH